MTVLYLGIDGGGTKTEFVAIDASRQVLARTVTGTTYHVQVGFDAVVQRLTQGVDTICRDLQATPADFASIFLGLPAYGEDSVVDLRLDEACGELIGHDRFACGNDMICGWAGSLDCADGINLVAGTGSIGYGERRGLSARAGGWGEVFSDEGSAYWIAIRGLNAFTRMSDGRLAKGVLHRHFVDALALKSDLDLCARVLGAHGMERDEIAGLARIVSQAAADGDASAREILDDAAAELAALAQSLRAQLGFEDGEAALLSWSGGVLAQEASVRAGLTARLDAAGGFALTEPKNGPGLGAALYAQHLAELKLHA